MLKRELIRALWLIRTAEKSIINKDTIHEKGTIYSLVACKIFPEKYMDWFLINEGT